MKGKGPMLKMSDLDPFEKQIVSDDFFSRRQDGKDMGKNYLEVLSSWGIICPHPQDRRLYEGSIRSEHHESNRHWFICEMCECHVINDAWMKENTEALRNFSAFKDSTNRGKKKED